jgi:hypothetical protein
MLAYKNLAPIAGLNSFCCVGYFFAGQLNDAEKTRSYAYDDDGNLRFNVSPYFFADVLPPFWDSNYTNDLTTIY